MKESLPQRADGSRERLRIGHLIDASADEHFNRDMAW
jgi:hypothetical protein